MKTLKEELQIIRELSDHVAGSLIIKSSDDDGTVVKWLKDLGDGTADRQQKFLQTDNTQTDLKYEDRDVILTIMVNDPV